MIYLFVALTSVVSFAIGCYYNARIAKKVIGAIKANYAADVKGLQEWRDDLENERDDLENERDRLKRDLNVARGTIVHLEAHGVNTKGSLIGVRPKPARKPRTKKPAA